MKLYEVVFKGSKNHVFLCLDCLYKWLSDDNNQPCKLWPTYGIGIKCFDCEKTN